MAAFMATAQIDDPQQLQETARSFMRQQDYTNAILILNKALQQAPNDLELNKDLFIAYYQKNDLPKAQNVLKPLVERNDADAAVYQMAGMFYKATNDLKEGERIYKKGIKSFPKSGALYNDYGELLWARQDFNAIKQWEKGIETDPGFSSNYYNAAKYYYYTTDKVWSLIYGEVFVNMESFTRRTTEMKGLLLESYKKLFTDADMLKGQDVKNGFVNSYLSVMNKQTAVAGNGITPESLTMIRTRFVLDWFEQEAGRYPFRLFEYQRQLLKEGTFNAYNQWMFGSIQNLAAYQNWMTTHAEEQSLFTSTIKNRLYKQPAGQYYQTMVVGK
jgi:Tetratricopeptide repeat